MAHLFYTYVYCDTEHYLESEFFWTLYQMFVNLFTICIYNLKMNLAAEEMLI